MFIKNKIHFSEHQFVCGLSLALGKEAQLSRADIQKVVEFYRVDKDRVMYKEFCDMMENGNDNLITLYFPIKVVFPIHNTVHFFNQISESW